MSTHRTIANEICQISCADAETSHKAEKAAIQAILEKEVGLTEADHMVRRAILLAFYERYELQDERGVTSSYSQALRLLQMKTHEANSSPRASSNIQSLPMMTQSDWPQSVPSSSKQAVLGLKRSDVLPSDVLFGRGGHSNNLEGNRRYHALLETRAFEYTHLIGRNAKTKFSMEVVSQLKEEGVRFLQFDRTLGVYFEATKEECRRKVSQRLRQLKYDIEENEKEKSDSSKPETNPVVPVALGTAPDFSVLGTMRNCWRAY